MSTKGDMVDFDTERQRLAIGSANQILQVKSSLPSWETVDLADTVLTTAGDVLYENATPELARLAAGTQYNTLQMGASLPAWAASSSSVLTAAQDILYSSSANTLARLAAGSDGKVLTTHSTGSAPTWETPSAGGATTVNNSITGSTNNQTTTSTSMVDMTGTTSATLSNESGGLATGILWVNMESDTAQAPRIIGVYYDSADQERTASSAPDADKYDGLSLAFNLATSAQVVQMRWSTGSGTLLSGNGGGQQSNCTITEVY